MGSFVQKTLLAAYSTCKEHVDAIIKYNQHYIEGTGRSYTCYIVKRTDEGKACTVEYFDYLTAQKEP